MFRLSRAEGMQKVRLLAMEEVEGGHMKTLIRIYDAFMFLMFLGILAGVWVGRIIYQ